jgi:transposase
MCSGSEPTCTTRPRLRSYVCTTRSLSRRFSPPTCALSRRPAPQQDEHGTYVHNGARRTGGLNTSMHDAGWHHVLSIRAFTPACAGKQVAAVNPAYTSQDCSGCEERTQLSLSVRTHVCTTCGLILDRDLNAASNMLWRGQRLRGVAGVPAALNREPVGL